ncbi:hypothetical protein BGZ94_004560 [Podila epigama]|nr:hypothetical protein BGZ94_004560 [Podila epigama]
MSHSTSDKQELDVETAQPSSDEQESKILDRSLFTRKELKILLGAILVHAYLRSFEVNLMYSCIGIVAAKFEVVSLTSILPTILEIMSTALVPFYTKVSDVVGRAQALTTAMFFYILGYTIQGTSKVFLQFALGQIAYGIGSTGLMTLCQVLIADSTKLIDRGIMFALWDMPAIINVFIANALIKPVTGVEGSTWRNVYIVTGCIATVGSVILLTPLWHLQKKSERAQSKNGRFQRKSVTWLLEEFDAVGAVLIVLGLSLTLLPIIIARTYEGNWSNPKILGMFFSGVIALILLVIWEAKYSKRPIMPVHIWSNRTCLGGLSVIFFFTVMNAFNYQYYTAYLVISRDIDFDQAILLERGYQVIYPIVELFTGLAMKRYNTCRPFIWAGIVIHTIGLGLQIPGRRPSSSDAFVVISQIVAGGGAGMAYVASIVAVTGAVAKGDVATVIGAGQILESFGYAFGSALSGGIWTQYLPARLAKHITSEYSEDGAMNDVFGYIKTLTETRPETKSQLVEAYADAQMLLLIIAMAMAVLVGATTLLMKHVDLHESDLRHAAEEKENDAAAIAAATSTTPEAVATHEKL